MCLPGSALADETGGDGALDLFSSETLTLTGDVRLVGVNGEASWVDDGFGKLRFGADSTATRVKPVFGEASLVWQPRFSWSLSGTVVALAQGEGRTEAGLSEAYLTFKPLSDGRVRFSARAGLMWPPVSLEHGGGDWAVTETITPSAINSWIGEEVKVLGLEAGARTQLGEHSLSATAAIFDWNDTSATLLTFRGWALHDRKAMAFRKQPLPQLNSFIQYAQPRFTHPVLDLDPGAFHRPGYYAKLAWDLPIPVHIEAIHYDNNGDPLAINADLEWGWRTRFDNIGLFAELNDKWQLRAQAMSGRTLMCYQKGVVEWVDTRFRSAYAMVTHKFDKGSVSARVDAFGTRNYGEVVTSEDNEDGWAATVAARRSLGEHATAMVEYLHVESRRMARSRVGLAADQTQDQLQLAMRLHW
jgi:hypothetical protein